MSWFEYYSAVILLILLTVFITLYLSMRNPILSHTQKKAFFLLFVSIICGASLEWISSSRPVFGWGNATARKTLRHINYRFAPAVGLFAGRVFDLEKLSICNFALTIANIIFQCIRIPFNLRISYDESTKGFVRQNLYWVYQGFVLLSLFLAAVSLFISRQKRQYKGWPLLISSQLLIIVALGIHIHYTGLYIDWIAFALSGVFVYVRIEETNSETDGLTLLLNRKTLENTLSHIDKNAIFIRVDLDNFKTINDKYGHRTGDQVLQDLSQRMKTRFSSFGDVFRYGGDEFVIIVKKRISHLDDVEKEFCREWEKKIRIHPFYPTFSIGKAYFTPGINTPREVLKEADENRYHAKDLVHSD